MTGRSRVAGRGSPAVERRGLALLLVVIGVALVAGAGRATAGDSRRAGQGVDAAVRGPSTASGAVDMPGNTEGAATGDGQSAAAFGSDSDSGRAAGWDASDDDLLLATAATGLVASEAAIVTRNGEHEPDAPAAPPPPGQVRVQLASFAAAVLGGNRRIAAQAHDLAAARAGADRVLAGFRPTLTVREQTSKQANRNYNPLTGIDEDYGTRHRGMTVGIGQKTPLGQVQYEVQKSRTEYAAGGRSHFQSAYWVLQTGIWQRDERRQRLERGQGRDRYTIQQARSEAERLEILHGACRNLIDWLLAGEHLAFRERNLAFYRTMVEEAEVKAANGLGAALDVKQARVRLTMAETERDESRLAVSEGEGRLGIDLGDPAWPRILVEGMRPASLAALVPREVEPASWVARGLQTRPDLRVLAAEVAAQRRALALSRERARPDLTSTIRWGRQGRGAEEHLAGDMRDRSWDWTVAWETSFGGPRSAALDRRADAERLRSLLLHQEQAIADARRAIAERAERVRFHRRSLDDLTRSRRLSAEILAGQRLNFSLGKQPLIELLRYQTDHESATLAQIRGEAALAQSWLQLLAETGDLVAWLQEGPAAIGRDPVAAAGDAGPAPAGGGDHESDQPDAADPVADRGCRDPGVSPASESPQ